MFFCKKPIIILLIISALYSTLDAKQGNSHSKNLKPGWVNVQSPQGFYLSINVGPGFLFFKGPKGNLSPTPIAFFSDYQGVDFKNVRQFNNNTTPLFEVMASFRVHPLLQCGISFYTQSGIHAESATSSSTNSLDAPAWAQFRSDLQLQALTFKLNLQPPKSLVIGSLALNSYLGLGLGPCWQSWTNNQVYESVLINQVATSSLMVLNNKINSNLLWTADLGFSFQPATQKATCKVCIGCRYVDWGSMPSIGLMKQQSIKVAPFKPVQAQKVFSWTPYIGVQFCF